ncbi:MAG: type II toxin-antitoxin system HicA family toxin [Thermoleophilia bacterium]|nr:type II toxin-antitoxin system HicA family toxin [Thermoleophilia bacterium]
MTGRQLVRRLRRTGCEVVRQRGSHVQVRCGQCRTTVPVYVGEDLPPGTLRAIERDLEPCIGTRWLR